MGCSSPCRTSAFACEVEDRVAALERAPKTLAVEHIALDELDTGALERARDELAPAAVRKSSKITTSTPSPLKPVGEGAADEPGAAGDPCPAHSV